jgi:hypothetical protein
MFNTFKKCCGIVAMFALYFYSAPAAFAQCADNEVTLTLVFDDYASETGWSILDADGNSVASAGSGSYAGMNGGTATPTACLPDGCYTLTMTDSANDGMCCTWGDGSYALTDADGNVLASGGDYGGSESTDFCVGDVSVPGCTDETACNYNAAATEDDGSCASETLSLSFTSNYYSSETSYDVFDADSGDVVASLYGSYSNGTTINETACLNDDACYYVVVYDSFGDGMGASGVWTISWNGMTIDNGGGSGWSSQTSETWCFGPGCTDSNASNFNMTATSDNGECEYLGCTDATACNYDEFATAEDGSCAYESLTIVINPDNFPSETSWSLTDDAGATIASGASSGTSLCVADGCYTFTMFDSFGDGICCSYGQGSYSVTDGNGLELASGGDYGSSESTSFCLPAFPGCTDDLACNYDEGANFDDGTCDYSCIGCMDQAAANYDPTATQENPGSCVYCEAGTYVMNIEMFDAGEDGWNGSSYYLDAYDGSVSITGNYDNADTYIDGVGTDFHCIPLGCYLFSHGGGSADGQNVVTVTDQFGTVYAEELASGTSWDIDFGLLQECDFEGCTDSYCFNYNISATIDDGSCICPPPNNAIADAEAIGCGMEVSGNLANASDEEGVTGVFAGTTVTTAGVWYEFNADGDYQVFANTCNTPTSVSGFADPVSDTKLHVFVYNDEGELEPIVGNDDNCGLMSRVAFLAETGNNYYIYVSRFSSFTSGSEFLLELTCEDCPEFPPNDFCADATPQVDDVTFTGSVCCSNPATIPAYGGTVYGVWFTFNSTDVVTGLMYDTFYFNLTNVSSGNLSLTIYLQGGDCESIGSYVGCLFTGTCAGSIESFISLEPDTDYYFFVGTTDASTCGDFEFTTTGIFLGCTDPSADNYLDYANQDDGNCVYSVVPENDDCENAFALECNVGYQEGSMGGATSDDLPSCDGEGVAPDPCTTAVYGQWPSAAFTPNCDAGMMQNITTCGYASEYSTVNLTAGETYVFASSFPDDVITIATAGGTVYAVGVAEVTYTAETTEAVRFYTHTAGCGSQTSCRTKSVGCGDLPGPPEIGGVWWTFAGTGELHTLNTCGSVIDTRVRVFSSPSMSCGLYECVTDINGEVADNNSSFDGCGFFEQDDAFIEFVSDPTLYYFVYVTYDMDGVFNGMGSYQIELTCEEAIEGCTIGAACNYNPDANIETNDICDYTSCACDNNPGGTAILVNMYDSFGDGWTGGNSGSPGGYEIFDGDGNSVASGAIDDADYIIDEDNYDGAEYGLDVLCLDPGCYTYAFTGAFLWAGEQSWQVTDGDGNELIAGGAGGSLVTEIYPFTAGADIVCGCMDAFACNYDEAATTENGTCEYETCAGCTDTEACDYDPTATIEDGSCCYGSCVTITMNDSFGDGWTGCYILITDLEGNEVVYTTLTTSNSDGSYLQEVYCLEAGCYILSTGDDTFSSEPSWSIGGVFGGVITGGELYGPEYFSVGGNNCIEGCDIACACNYDPAANILVIEECNFDDCSGCTYADATNFDANAGVDDGSCEFDLSNPCPADINEDGSVTTADLLQFLGAFGTVCE